MHVLRALLILSLMVLVLLDATAVAQQQKAADTALTNALEAIVEPKKEEARANKRQVQRDPLVRSGLTLPEPQLSFETTKTNGRATGTIGVVNPRPSGELTILVALSSPIGDSQNAEARPLDLRGLSNGANVTIAVSGASMFRRFSDSDIRKLCTGIPKEDCTAGKLEEKNPELSQHLLDTVFRRVPLIYAATVTYGRNKFSFFDQQGVQQAPVSRNDIEVEGTLGFLVNRRTNLLAFHASYSDTHQASSDTTQLCRPLPESTVTRCDPAILGGPVEERSVIGTIEYRVQFAGKGGIPIGLAPKGQFAVGSNGTGNIGLFEIPVYFFQEKVDANAATSAPKLNGGASAGWRSDNGFQVSVFIGTTFKLFKI